MPSQMPHSVTAGVESALGPAPANRAQPEVVVLRFRQHGARLVLPVALLLAVSVLAGYWVGALPDAWMNLAALVGAVLAAFLIGVLPILSWMAHRATVTSHRVIMRHGLLSRTRNEVALSRVREVRLRRGVLQRLRGAGDIEVLHGNDAFVLRDVPGASGIADALHDLMERNYENATRMQQRLSGLVGAQGASGRYPPGIPGPGSTTVLPREPSGGPAASADPGTPVSFW